MRKAHPTRDARPAEGECMARATAGSRAKESNLPQGTCQGKWLHHLPRRQLTSHRPVFWNLKGKAKSAWWPAARQPTLSSSAPTPVCPGAANSPPLAEGPRAGVRQSISEGQLGRPPGWAQEGQLRQACKSAGSCFCGVSGRQPHSASFCCLRVIEAGATLIFIIPPLSSV